MSQHEQTIRELAGALDQHDDELVDFILNDGGITDLDALFLACSAIVGPQNISRGFGLMVSMGPDRDAMNARLGSAVFALHKQARNGEYEAIIRSFSVGVRDESLWMLGELETVCGISEHLLPVLKYIRENPETIEMI